MILIVISEVDDASINIREKLLRMRNWVKEAYGYSYGELALVNIPDYHLYHDNIDLELEQNFGLKVDKVIFASKHESKAKLRTLSVHSIGNFGKAEYGGIAKALAPAAPHLMTSALRILEKRAKEKELAYKVSFEVTHHGPFLSTPAFFIEIGSDVSAWRNEYAGEVIGATILESVERVEENKVAIGIGGGHYAPRFTELALARKISFAHLVPNYQLENLDDEMIDKIIELSTPELVYFHRKAMKKEIYKKLVRSFELKGLKAVREKDLALR